LNVFEAANNLFLPRGFRIFIDGVVKTVDQTASQIRTLLVRQGKGFLSNSWASCIMPQNYIPWPQPRTQRL
jgi:hypothetical protein